MTPSVRFESITPALAVRDLDAALRFYTKTLGFDIAWVWGTPADLAAVCRDRVEITLAQRADAQPQGASRIYLRVVGIDAFHAHVERNGARIIVPIGDRAYGMRDFRVIDPDGNELDIGQAIDPTVAG